MARRRGKVLKEPLRSGGNVGLEKLWRSGSGCRTGQGRGEAAPRAGQQEALPAAQSRSTKVLCLGLEFCSSLASPRGGSSFKDTAASPGPAPGQGPSEPLLRAWGQPGLAVPAGWLPALQRCQGGDRVGGSRALNVARVRPGWAATEPAREVTHQHLEPPKPGRIGANFC